MESPKPVIYSIILTLALFSVLHHVAGASKSNQKQISEETQTRIIRPFPKPKLSQIEIQVKSMHQEANNNQSTEREILVQNSAITLNKDLRRVELICKASHPIKWEFLVNDVPIPIFEVHYKRTFLPHPNGSASDMKQMQHQLENPTTNKFGGRVVLRGLLESQSGTYSCRYYNGRLTNNSYENSANLTVFIPGEHIFTTISHTQYIERSSDSVVISCPVSNPNLSSGVALQKLKTDVFSNGRKQEWEQVSAHFSPSLGFLVRKESVFLSPLVGTYKCIVFRSEASVTVRVVERDLRGSVLGDDNISPKNEASCWNTPSCMEIVRSQRLECYCKDSFALFVNMHQKSGTSVNRRGNCSDLESSWKRLSNLTHRDWRVEEFLRNGEEGQSVCFRDKIRNSLNGTGARAILRAIKMPRMDDEKNHTIPSLVNFTIKFDGLPGWATGFKLGLEYFHNSSLPLRSNAGNISVRGDNGVNKTDVRTRIHLLNQEPSSTQLFPLAHYQAVWRNVLIDLNEVRRIHVFQPDSFSFQWFQISSAVINNDDATTGTTTTNTIHAQVNTPIHGDHDVQACGSPSKENTICESQGFSIFRGKYLLAISLGGFALLLVVVLGVWIYFRLARRHKSIEARMELKSQPQGFIPAFNNPCRMPNVISYVRRSFIDQHQQAEEDANICIVNQNTQ